MRTPRLAHKSVLNVASIQTDELETVDQRPFDLSWSSSSRFWSGAGSTWDRPSPIPSPRLIAVTSRSATVEAYVRAGVAPATRRAYRADLDRSKHGAEASRRLRTWWLPISPNRPRPSKSPP